MATFSRLITFHKFTRVSISRNIRAMSSFLIDSPKYSFLKDLDLEKVNAGVYNGKWTARGQVSRPILNKIMNHYFFFDHRIQFIESWF